MKRALIGLAATVLLVFPAGAAAAKPTKMDRHNAAKECRLERGSTEATREAFKQRYGTNKNKKNAFGKCVSRRARDERTERHEARQNAAQACRAERSAVGEKTFGQSHGKDGNAKNAFGKCVSAKARENKKKADSADRQRIADRKSAAKDCATERSDIGKPAFNDKYGTNSNKHNSFGKCVSAKAKERAHART